MAGPVPQAQPPPEPRPRPLWRLRRNPLCRRSDRTRGWIFVVLLCAVLLAAPAALLVVGDSAYRHYKDTAAHQERTRASVSATLVHDAPRHPEPGSDEALHARYPVTVRFTGPDGVTRTGKADVQPGLPARSTVSIWVDTAGNVTGPPLSIDGVRSRAIAWALLASLGVILTGLAAYAVTAVILHRRNLARWDRAWAATAPRWSKLP